MAETADCKGCTASVRLTEDEISALTKLALTENDSELVNEARYAVRLNICQSCPALQYGTTCRYCGGLVQIKAKQSTAKCPYPGSPRW